MVSKSKLKRLEKRRKEEEARKKKEAEESKKNQSDTSNDAMDEDEDFVARTQIDASHIIATGTLISADNSPDLQIDKFGVNIYGKELIEDTTLVISANQRYGLIGSNGSGKSSLMTVLGRRLVQMPENRSIYFLDKEAPATDHSALEYMLHSVEEERVKLNQELVDPETTEERMMIVYERIEELDPDTAEARAAKILHGLGFDKFMQQKKTKEFSGGWRMRISLAEALFINPDLLLLDEPTNHLDLEAVVWLERYLRDYKKALVLISHSQDFLNTVCTSIMNLHGKKLMYYGGNYDSYVMTRNNSEINQMKRFRHEQDQIQRMRNYVAKFGHGSRKLARQGKSKEKILKKMEAKGLTERVHQEKVLKFRFPACSELTPPVIKVDDISFTYPASNIIKQPKPIFNSVRCSIDLDSRVALVGPNGAGKSTFLKLINRKLKPTTGNIHFNSHLKIGWYHQHLTELLTPGLSPLEFMFQQFPDENQNNSAGVQRMRSALGPFGITGKNQTNPMNMLSDGLKSRVVFAWLAYQNPHLLLLDEPTNHLDIETIDSLADAINNFSGGVILVSHDFRLISQVADEIWECKDGTVTKFEGDILGYKEHLLSEIEKAEHAEDA